MPSLSIERRKNMLAYKRFKSNNIGLKILLFIPNLLICLGIFIVNLFISIGKYIYKLLTKEYKNEVAYHSFISLVIGLLFLVLVVNSSKDFDYMFLDDLPNAINIVFMSIFFTLFVTFFILYFVLKNKKKRFWLSRTISYILTFILLFVALCFIIHYVLHDEKVFKVLIEGSWYTIILFVVTLLFGLPLGLALAFGSMSKRELIKKPVKTLIWVIRGTPLMLQILVVSSLVLLFGIANRDVNDFLGISMTTLLFIYVCIAFIINYACYFSEIYRSGIESTPKGQYEACKVLGMTKHETFYKVVLMQVVKKIIPPMSNEIITLVKDTALASVLVAIDLFSVAKHEVTVSALLTPYVYAAVFYLIFNGVLTICFNRIETRLGYYEV